jgi:hypothetical protein
MHDQRNPTQAEDLRDQRIALTMSSLSIHASQRP